MFVLVAERLDQLEAAEHEFLLVQAFTKLKDLVHKRRHNLQNLSGQLTHTARFFVEEEAAWCDQESEKLLKFGDYFPAVNLITHCVFVPG